jgi:hypothetical protein
MNNVNCKCTIILVGKPVGKYPIGRSKRKGNDNLKIHLREMGCEDGVWMELN